MGGSALAIYAVAFALILIFRPHLDRLGVERIVFGTMATVLAWVIESCGYQIRSYVPTTSHDAKIANEKIKLWVTTLNSIALALIAAGFVLPVVETFKSPNVGAASLPTENLASFLLIAVVGYVHIRARSMFNYLKDEKSVEDTVLS